MAFPSTSVLDNFTGTDGTDLPVYSANWQATPTGGSTLEIQANAATGTSAGGNNTNSWVTDYGPDCEVYVTINTKPADGNVILLLARGQQTTSLLTADGYALRFVQNAGTDTFVIQRITNGAATSLSSTFSQEVTNGDSIGLEIVGNTLTAYYKAGGGAWTSLGSTTDSTYTAAGKIGMLTSSTGVRLDDFGGGTYVATGVTGTVAVTTADDTSTASGSTTVTGSSTTTTANDTSTASGTTIVTGSANVTTADDTSSANGTTIVTGSVAVTTADDTATASGSVGGAVDGSASITTQDDTSSASGTTTVLGVASSVTGNDTSSATGSPIVTGLANVTTGDDVSTANGSAGNVTGSADVTTGNDIASAFGIVPQENLFGGVAHFAKLSERSQKLRKLEHLDRIQEATASEYYEAEQIPQEVKEIISNVAKIDNEKQQRAHLKAQLKALEIHFKQEYADALKTEMIRTYLIAELERQEEEETIAMMMALVQFYKKPLNWGFFYAYRLALTEQRSLRWPFFILRMKND